MQLLQVTYHTYNHKTTNSITVALLYLHTKKKRTLYTFQFSFSGIKAITQSKFQNVYSLSWKHCIRFIWYSGLDRFNIISFKQLNIVIFDCYVWCSSLIGGLVVVVFISAQFLRKREKRQATMSAAIRPRPFNSLASIQNHAHSRERTNFTAPGSDLIRAFCSSSA